MFEHFYVSKQAKGIFNGYHVKYPTFTILLTTLIRQRLLKYTCEIVFDERAGLGWPQYTVFLVRGLLQIMLSEYW